MEEKEIHKEADALLTDISELAKDENQYNNINFKIHNLT